MSTNEQTTSENVCTVKGAGKFLLPENRVARLFENQANFSIIDTDLAGTPQGGLGVIASVHLRAHRGEEQQRKAIVELLIRNGAQPISVPA